MAYFASNDMIRLSKLFISFHLMAVSALQGNEMQIRPANFYLRDGEDLSFYEVILRARQRREVVIGYRLASAEQAVINPPSKHEKQKWTTDDLFVVIAEKE